MSVWFCLSCETGSLCPIVRGKMNVEDIQIQFGARIDILYYLTLNVLIEAWC